MATETLNRTERVHPLAPDVLVSEHKVRPTVFEPFSYAPALGVAPASLDMLARLSNEVRSVAAGVSDILAILERDSIDEGLADESGDPLPRLVSVTTAGNLHRLSIVALDLLAERAEKALELVERQVQ